jgi:hypothetical protein
VTFFADARMSSPDHGGGVERNNQRIDVAAEPPARAVGAAAKKPCQSVGLARSLPPLPSLVFVAPWHCQANGENHGSKSCGSSDISTRCPVGRDN